MDIGFDRNDLRQKPADCEMQDGRVNAPDWHALRARLVAAWSARRAMANGISTEQSHIGSFDQHFAQVLSGFGAASISVNLTASGNLKPGETIAESHAGEWLTGGRG